MMRQSRLDLAMEQPAASIAFERIADVRARTRTIVCGTVVRVKTRRSTSVPSIEVALEDPSGTAFAVWPGRSTIPGVGLGGRMLIEGVASETSRGFVFLNPSYRLLPER